jgi:hypothetical protein
MVSKISDSLYTPSLEHGTPETFSAIAACIEGFLPVLAFHLVFQGYGTPGLNRDQFKLIKLALQVTFYF